MYSIVILGNELQEVPKKYFGLIHTELDLMPLWKEHQMKGQATLTLVPYFYAQNKLVLDIKYLEILLSLLFFHYLLFFQNKRIYLI